MGKTFGLISGSSLRLFSKVVEPEKEVDSLGAFIVHIWRSSDTSYTRVHLLAGIVSEVGRKYPVVSFIGP